MAASIPGWLATNASGSVTRAGVQVSHEPSPDIYYIKIGNTGLKQKRSGQEVYIADPAIVKLPNGYYVMTHSLFGGDTTADTSPISKIFRSTDNGITWTLMKEVNGLRRASLFVYNNVLYLIGSYSLSGNGSFNVGILKSTDNGATWSTPADSNNGILVSGETGTTKTPQFYNNRVWISLGAGYSYSAALSSDLMKASSWTRSTPAPPKTLDAINKWPAPVALYFGGTGGVWSESQIVASAEHGVTVMPKIQFQSPNAVPHTALFHISAADGKNMTCDAAEDFVPLTGTQKKFGAIHDPVSKKYYALTNTVLHADKDVIDPNSQQVKHELIRNTATLVSSVDLRHWDVEKIFIHARDAEHTGWQYLTFIVDGDDLAIASRTAFKTAEDQYSPPRGHDSNLLTFHRLENFRSLAPTHYIKCENGTVNRHETTHYEDAPLGYFAAGHTFASTPDALAQAGDGTVYIRESGGAIKAFDAHGNHLGSVDALPAGLSFTTTGTLSITQPPPGSRNWQGEYGTDWYDPRNWYYWNRPDTGAESATFGTSITAATTVKLAQPYTLASLAFRSPHGYAIAPDSIKSSDGTLTYGTGALTLKAGSGASALTVHQGSHVINVPLTLPATTNITLAADTALTVGSTLAFQAVIQLNIALGSAAPSSAPLTVKTLTKSGAASINVNLTGVTAATPPGTKIIAITDSHNLAAADFTVTANVAVTHVFENNTLSISRVPVEAIAAQQLKAQLEASGTATVAVTSSIDLSLVGGAIVTSAKTIEGADASATISGDLTFASGASDTILRGVTFASGTFVINGANDVDISHCTFTDTPVSITGGSDNIAFSWNQFAATTAGAGSAMTIANAGSVTGILLDHNLWNATLRSNMPNAINARVLMFNNYIAATGNTTATIAGAGAQILSVRNIYQGVNNPITKQSTGLVRAIDNFMNATTGTTALGEDDVFVPAYSHIMNPAGSSAATLASLISANAGNTAGKNSVTPAQTNGSASISATVTGSGAISNSTGATVSGGSGFTLTANASGFTPTSRQWYLDNFPLSGATTSTHTVTNAGAADHAGAYAVELTAATGEIVTSGAFMLTVGALAAPVITTHPVSQTVTVGASATFTAIASGNSLAYQWQKDGADISGATGASYTITSAQQYHAGSYTVRVSNSAGSVTSNAATLTVNASGGSNNNNGGGSSGGDGGGGAPGLLWLCALASLLAFRAAKRR